MKEEKKGEDGEGKTRRRSWRKTNKEKKEERERDIRKISSKNLQSGEMLFALLINKIRI